MEESALVASNDSKRERKKRRKASRRRTADSSGGGGASVVSGDGGSSIDDDDATRSVDARSIGTRSLDSSTGGGGGMGRDERRRTRAARRLVAQFAALGLDEHGQPLDNFSLLKYPVREWKFTLPGTSEAVACNPVVTLFAVVCLWSLAAWATVNPVGAHETLIEWRDGVTLRFTWFYQISKVIMCTFILWITWKYGHIRLGRKKDKPEYSGPTYFCMIFAANVGASLLANGAADPLYLQTEHFFAMAGYRSQDEIDQFAVNMTVVNWGIGSWTSIALVAVCMSLAGHCFNLPMTFRSCYYPIFGAYTWGWIGDWIDTSAVVVAVACACAMLGSTAILITDGFRYLGLVDMSSTEEDLKSIRSVAIWIITIVSTLSVISGLRGGIQYMPLVAMFFGVIVTLLIFVLDDTKYLLNLTVQEAGYYLQNSLFQLNFWTDAFGQLREGSGRAVDDKAAEQYWTGSWPISYQAWATCLAPIVGTFVGYISRGRRLWEITLYTFAAPIVALLFWSCIWAGVSLRQSRQVLELIRLGETYYNNSEHFLADGSEFCYEVPQNEVVLDGEVIFTNHLPGVTPVCTLNHDDPGMVPYNSFDSFRHAESFSGHGLSLMLALLFLFGCAFFYIAHADSATFIVDTLASNGRKNYHWSRRMFWAGTLAALSSALEAAEVISSSTLLCSFPMAVLLCYLMQSVTLFCRAAEEIRETDDHTEYCFPEQPEFSMPIYGGIFNVVEYIVSLGKVNAGRVERGMHLPTRDQVREYVVSTFVPFVSLYKVLKATYPKNPKTNAVVVAVYSICFLGSVGVALASIPHPGLIGVAAVMVAVSGAILAMIRSTFRRHYNIRSNSFADWVCSTLLWPQVLAQMRLHRTSKAVDRTIDMEAMDREEEA